MFTCTRAHKRGAFIVCLSASCLASRVSRPASRVPRPASLPTAYCPLQSANVSNKRAQLTCGVCWSGGSPQTSLCPSVAIQKLRSLSFPFHVLLLPNTDLHFVDCCSLHMAPNWASVGLLTLTNAASFGHALACARSRAGSGRLARSCKRARCVCVECACRTTAFGSGGIDAASAAANIATSASAPSRAPCA